MLIDSHCHLTYEIDPAGVDAVIARARDAGVGIIICPTADPIDVPAAIKLADTRDNVFATIGIHPEHAGCTAADYITDEILAHPRVLGVGEIGLDYHGDDVPARDAQIKLFTEQLEMARRGGLPVAIHTRDAEEDTATILADFPEIGGVMYCFTSGWGLAKKMLDRGFYFSASGILTFKTRAIFVIHLPRFPPTELWLKQIPHTAPRCHIADAYANRHLWLKRRVLLPE